ncbi:MAG TPA: hypothetical protein VFF73_25610 [Planctomycetota bacterium]|nr:hypothetical protein [Planctomycetota bacterium]
MKRMSLPGAALWAALVALGGCDRGANATIVATNQASVPYKPVKLDATSRERFGGSGPHGMGMPGPTQPENESPQQGPQVPITWDLPSGWQVRPTNAPPMGGMKILGSFLVANNPEAACSIVIMQGTGGGLEANVNRWRGQLGATPLTPAEIDALPKRALLGTPAYVVEAEGSFGGMAGTERKPGFKLLGAICPIHDLTLFVKLTGPAALVNAEHVHFDQLCDSLRLTGGEREQGDTPEAAKGPLEWDAPAEWRKLPDRPDRVVTFAAGTATECAVTMFGGAAGGVTSNVNRWRATQFGQPPLDDAAIAALPKVKVFGQDAPLVEVSGTYKDAQGGVHDGFALVATMAPHGGSTIFLKLTGPEAEVRIERERFIAFVSTLR